MSSCHLPIPLFSVYHCMRRNIGKLSKTSFFTGKYRNFFLRKFGFLRVSGAFRGEGRGLPRDSVGLQWDFSVIIWGSSKKIWWAVSDSTLWVLNENLEINDEILGVSNDYFDDSHENLEVTNEMVLGNFYKSGVSNDTPKMKILSQTRT